MSGPIRIQRQRTKGWKMPENTVYVGRPSRWANPFRIGNKDGRTGGYFDRSSALERFTDQLTRGAITRFAEDDVRRELRGKNLACWCSLKEPCHADVLLEIANAPKCEAA